MAPGMLVVPISTMASKISFCGRVQDEFMSSLTPKLVEVLICVNKYDWMILTMSTKNTQSMI
ncbi:hypothetical protein ACS0TY_005682 [Phlomoides rotata]